MPRTRRIRVNERDVRTLAIVGEYGVLDRALCHTLCFPRYSQEWCRQNLARLAGALLLRTTVLTVWHDEEETRGGRIPLLYSLTSAGAEVVHARTGVYPRRVLRSDPSPTTFWHRLQVVRVRVAFDQAAEHTGLPAPRWIMEQDLRPDAPADAMPQHRRMLYHEFHAEDGAVVTCRPDAAASLSIPHPSGDAAKMSTLAIHFEIDRSREGLAQCLGKVPGYSALFAQRAYARYWPDLSNPVHRVFWVVPSHQRIESLAAAFRAFPASAHFRFTTFTDCRPDRVLTQPVWCDLHGNPMTLYRKTPAGTPPA
jgi:hypothetical protein